jgi:hypothetical protein
LQARRRPGAGCRKSSGETEVSSGDSTLFEN